jgi:uncharacterized protein
MSRPVRFEIPNDDPEAAAEFYRTALGWTIASWSGPQDDWLVPTGADGPGIDGGRMPRHFPQPVINTIGVAALAETIGRVGVAGGWKVHGPHEIPRVGRHAYCADPTGIRFGILQPASP